MRYRVKVMIGGITTATYPSLDGWFLRVHWKLESTPGHKHYTHLNVGEECVAEPDFPNSLWHIMRVE